MHRPIIRVLSAMAAAAIAGTLALTTAAAAPAAQAPSGGPPEYTCTPATDGTSGPCEAGYEGQGRDFRYAQAVITVPNRGSNTDDPAMYVALERAGNEFAMIGVRPCQTSTNDCPVPTGPTANDGGWEFFYQVESGGTADPVDFEGDPVPNGTSGVLVSVYFNANQASVNFQATVNGTTVINSTVPVSGSLYPEAEAVADWRYPLPPGGVSTFVPGDPTNPFADTRVTQFLDGRFTTQNGDRDTFSGPWTLVPLSVTSNGKAPGIPGGGTLIAEPSYLWTDSLTLDGKWGDAFGVWLRGNGVTPTPTPAPA
jgi:hypothetical protein